VKNKDVPVQWSASLSVGIEPFDDDHKLFFSLANILLSAIELEDPALDLVIRTTTNILVEYVDAHFLREEMAMEASKYPETESHKKLHAIFKVELYKLINDYDSGRTLAGKQIADLVISWSTAHIASFDMLYKNYISSTDVDPRPLVSLLRDGEDDAASQED
jgi:hemerythrin-like metal-binding protein